MTSHPGDLGAVVPEVAEEEGAGPLAEPEPWWCAAVLRWRRGWSRDYRNLLTLSAKSPRLPDCSLEGLCVFSARRFEAGDSLNYGGRHAGRWVGIGLHRDLKFSLKQQHR